MFAWRLLVIVKFKEKDKQFVNQHMYNLEEISHICDKNIRSSLTILKKGETFILNFKNVDIRNNEYVWSGFIKYSTEIHNKEDYCDTSSNRLYMYIESTSISNIA